MHETPLRVDTLKQAAVGVIDQVRSRLPLDGAWLHARHEDGRPLEVGEDAHETARFTLQTAVRTAVRVVAGNAPWIYHSILQHLVDDLFHDACGTDAEDWTRQPGRTIDQVQEALGKARDHDHFDMTEAKAWGLAHDVFTRMDEVLAGGGAWMAGDRAQASRNGTDCPIEDPEASHRTTAGAFELAARELRKRVRPVEAAYGELASHLLIEAYAGAPELEDSPTLRPYTRATTLTLLNHLLADSDQYRSG